MGKIILEDIEFYAYHGCMEEEKILGNRFIVNVILETDTDKASATDKIEDTLNYKTVFELVKKEMEIRANLLENVTSRIIESLFSSFNQLDHAIVKVSKLNPPVGGKMRCVSVELSQQKP